MHDILDYLFAPRDSLGPSSEKLQHLSLSLGGQALEDVDLNVPDSDRRAGYMKELRIQPSHRRLNLQTLRISGFNAEELFNPIRASVSIADLSDFFISGCRNASTFLRQFGRALKDLPKGSSLRHLYVEFQGPESCVTDIFDCSPHLTHVSLVIVNDLDFMYVNSRILLLVDRIARVGPTLKSFGFQMHHTGEPPWNDKTLRNVCAEFPRESLSKTFTDLKQLGFHLVEDDLDPSLWEDDENSDFAQHWVCIPSHLARVLR